MKSILSIMVSLLVIPILSLTSCTAKYVKEEQNLEKQLADCNKQLSQFSKQKAEDENKLKKDEDTYNQLAASLKDEIQKDEVMLSKHKDAVTINIAER